MSRFNKIDESRITREETLRGAEPSNYTESIARYYLGLTHIAPHEVPPGFKYGWSGISVAGRPMKGLREAAIKGWKPVPIDRHPRFKIDDFEGLIEKKHNYIEVDGLILVERPIALHEQEHNMHCQAAYDQENSVKIHTVAGLEMYSGHDRQWGRLARFG
jgi:hypothetical protein